MIHCSALKSACSTLSSVGRIAGTLDISRPNISEERQAAIRATMPLIREDGREAEVMLWPFDVETYKGDIRCRPFASA
jgi:hypothetical protein